MTNVTEQQQRAIKKMARYSKWLPIILVFVTIGLVIAGPIFEIEWCSNLFLFISVIFASGRALSYFRPKDKTVENLISEIKTLPRWVSVTRLITIIVILASQGWWGTMLVWMSIGIFSFLQKTNPQSEDNVTLSVPKCFADNIELALYRSNISFKEKQSQRINRCKFVVSKSKIRDLADTIENNPFDDEWMNKIEVDDEYSQYTFATLLATIESVEHAEQSIEQVFDELMVR